MSDAQLLSVIQGILAAELALIGLFFMTLAIAKAWCWADEVLNPHIPYCDIDPRCHPAFVWAQDGSGWIRGVCVFPSKDVK